VKIDTFELERGQSLWENRVEINLSESGVHPVTLAELAEMGLDLEELVHSPLVYVQTNGSPELREALSDQYAGTTPDWVEVTNGTAEANYLVAHVLLEPGDCVLCQTPNYLQMAGMARNLGADVHDFPLLQERGWQPDWDAFERGLEKRPRFVYVSHPNNPTGAVLDEEAIERIVRSADAVGAWVIADEVYRGAELDGELSPSFWGRGERVIVNAGLSKAYGIPGVRIGWVVAPPALVDECWKLHDYTTIAPGALSDRIARFAVQPDIQKRLWARARRFMVPNRERFRGWAAERDGLHYDEPRAGAYAFVRYDLDVGSVELCDRVRLERSVLVVPGAWTGMEHYLRIGLGPPAEVFDEGLRRLGEELREVAAAR
jgi:aspartate/methionine/tyrosine aminotransferase